VRRRRSLAALAIAAVLGATAAPTLAVGVVEDRGTLRATVAGGQVLTFSSPIKRIAVADETLAAVHLVSDREVLLNGLRPGVTTLFIWLDDDRRVRYVLRVGPNIDFVAQALREIDPRISVDISPDGSSIILRGDVVDARTARIAKEQADLLLHGSTGAGGAGEVLNLLRYPGITATAEDRLAATLETIDPRIRVRRIQVGIEPDSERDSFVLEGNVRTLSDLQRAIAVAERQLGGTGVGVKVANDDRIGYDRARNFNAGIGGGGGGGGRSALGGTDPSASGLAAKLARGLVLSSESGRVLSFLEVDELSQVMVSIRVLQVDRGKARRMGVNFRLDAEHISIGNYTGPQSPAGLPGQLGGRPDVGSFGGGAVGQVFGTTTNLVASFVDRASAIFTAIDFLNSKNLVRSVAEPNILTLSGEQATVMVGGEVPIPTTATNQVATVQGFSFQDFGVRLDIRPTVDANGIVTLEVAPSIVRPDSGLAVGQVPGFQIQTVQTTARVAAGQSLVLGGLLSFEEGLEQRGMPGLDKLPIFRWKNKTHSEQELLFIITPQLMGVASGAAAEAELGPLAWPEDRGEWIEAMPPPRFDSEGIPPSFATSPEPAILTPAPQPVPAPAPAPVDEAPAPAPPPPGAEPSPAGGGLEPVTESGQRTIASI
jgi:Flp pilus assembly secretin CpaC